MSAEDNELREQIKAFKRPTPQEATYLIEVELEDLVEFIRQDRGKAVLYELEHLQAVYENGDGEFAFKLANAIEDRIHSLQQPQTYSQARKEKIQALKPVVEQIIDMLPEQKPEEK